MELLPIALAASPLTKEDQLHVRQQALVGVEQFSFSSGRWGGWGTPPAVPPPVGCSESEELSISSVSGDTVCTTEPASGRPPGKLAGNDKQLWRHYELVVLGQLPDPKGEGACWYLGQEMLRSPGTLT